MVWRFDVLAATEEKFFLVCSRFGGVRRPSCTDGKRYCRAKSTEEPHWCSSFKLRITRNWRLVRASDPWGAREADDCRRRRSGKEASGEGFKTKLCGSGGRSYRRNHGSSERR